MAEQDAADFSALTENTIDIERLTDALHNLLDKGEILERKDGFFVQSETETVFEGKHPNGVVGIQLRQTNQSKRLMLAVSEGSVVYRLTFGGPVDIKDTEKKWVQFNKMNEGDVSKSQREGWSFVPGKHLPLVGLNATPTDLPHLIDILEHTKLDQETQERIVVEQYLRPRYGGYSRKVAKVASPAG